MNKKIVILGACAALFALSGCGKKKEQQPEPATTAQGGYAIPQAPATNVPPPPAPPPAEGQITPPPPPPMGPPQQNTMPPPPPPPPMNTQNIPQPDVMKTAPAVAATAAPAAQMPSGWTKITTLKDSQLFIDQTKTQPAGQNTRIVIKQAFSHNSFTVNNSAGQPSPYSTTVTQIQLNCHDKQFAIEKTDYYVHDDLAQLIISKPAKLPKFRQVGKDSFGSSAIAKAVCH